MSEASLPDSRRAVTGASGRLGQIPTVDEGFDRETSGGFLGVARTPGSTEFCLPVDECPSGAEFACEVSVHRGELIVGNVAHDVRDVRCGLARGGSEAAVSGPDEVAHQSPGGASRNRSRWW